MKPHRIPLDNTSFEGKNNAYLIDGKETVLIDTGVRTAETRSQLQHALSQKNLEYERLAAVTPIKTSVTSRTAGANRLRQGARTVREPPSSTWDGGPNVETRV